MARGSKKGQQGEYNVVIEEIVGHLEGLARVKAPAVEYLAALERAKDRIEEWLEASIAAARDDVRRQSGE